MYVVLVLLPLYDAQSRPWPQQTYTRLAAELTERFGGVTAYTRAPAEGLWEQRSGDVGRMVHDELVLYEVMVEELDVAWWKAWREEREREFRQDRIVVRAHAVDIL